MRKIFVRALKLPNLLAFVASYEQVLIEVVLNGRKTLGHDQRVYSPNLGHIPKLNHVFNQLWKGLFILKL